MSEEANPHFADIVRHMSAEKFAEVLSASARKAREIYFQRHAIKKPKKSNRISKMSAQSEERVKALFDTLQSADDHELVEEMLRTWLLGKRELLAAALDAMGIEHDNGLTDSEEVQKFEDLKGAELKKLVETLSEHAPKEDVELYLRFMGAQF